MRRHPTTPWLAVADLDPTQIRRRFFMLMVGGAMRAPVKGWRISVGVPVAAYVFMAKLRAVPASHEIGTTQLLVKTAPDCGLGGRWRHL